MTTHADTSAPVPASKPDAAPVPKSNRDPASPHPACSETACAGAESPTATCSGAACSGASTPNAAPDDAPSTGLAGLGSTQGIIALMAAIREQANAFIQARLAEKGVADLLPAHGAVLGALFRQSPMLMSELAQRIGRKKNTVTGLINTLEDRGYCSRTPAPHDARAQMIALTTKGEAMRAVQQEVSEALLLKVWGHMPDAERQACVRSLHTILRNLEQE